MTENKLFAVYLGGRAPKCNTELHDVVFVTGKTIDETYEQLMDKWFGTPKGLHIDSWLELKVIDGYRITLNQIRNEDIKKLYFVNLGAYQDTEFSEIHINKFLVAESMQEAKLRAKEELSKGLLNQVHTDNIYEVDSCIELKQVNALYIELTKTEEYATMKPNNGYHIIPKPVVEDYIKRHSTHELVDAK